MFIRIEMHETYNDREFTLEENAEETWYKADNTSSEFSKDENLAAEVALLDKLYREARTYLLRRMSLRASALIPQVTYGGVHAKPKEGE